MTNAIIRCSHCQKPFNPLYALTQTKFNRIYAVCPWCITENLIFSGDIIQES